MRLEKRIAKQRERREFRVRNTCRATGRPRLSIHRSNNHIYAQVIDDVAGKTIASACSTEKDLGGVAKDNGNVDAAKKVGAAIGKRAVANGVTVVSFDRGSYRYHGRVAALADAAREAGLQF
jgi:large subunit ribosomal protein L18